MEAAARRREPGRAREGRGGGRLAGAGGATASSAGSGGVRSAETGRDDADGRAGGADALASEGLKQCHSGNNEHRSWFLNSILQQKETGLLGEVVNVMAGAEKI